MLPLRLGPLVVTLKWYALPSRFGVEILCSSAFWHPLYFTYQCLGVLSCSRSRYSRLDQHLDTLSLIGLFCVLPHLCMCIRVPAQVAAQGVLVMAGGQGSNDSYNGSSMLLNDVWVSLAPQFAREAMASKLQSPSFHLPRRPPFSHSFCL